MMILDSLDHADRYSSLHPRFPEAFRLFRELAARTDLQPGRLDLGQGDQLFAVIVDAPGRAVADAKLETHNAYIDIQFTTGGCDRLGWAPREAMRASEGYDATKDLEFYAAAPVTWFDAPAGHFAIFFPEDAHAPLANTGAPTRKIVLKVAV